MTPRRMVAALPIVAIVALGSPPLDPWLDRSMPRLMLLEFPAWLLLGWLTTRRSDDILRRWDPRGATGLVIFLATQAFWMLPRSIDWIGASPLANQLMHASLLLAGATLGASLPSLSFVVRGALGIYAASMTFALGMLYSNYSALLCGTFDLSQQKATGRLLLMLSPAVLLLVIGAVARSLARQQRHADPA